MHQDFDFWVSGVADADDVAQSLRSIDWTDFEPAPVRAAPTSGVSADCAEFRIRRVVLGAGGAPAAREPMGAGAR